MCPPTCQETVLSRLSTSRRDLFRGAGLALAGGAIAASLPKAPAFAEAPRSFSRVVDLTHTLSPEFPTFFGEPGIGVESLFNFADNGFNVKRFTVVEHTGTHMDAPIHFSADGQTADEIPVEHLVVPLAIVDIRAKAADDADAQVTPDDLAAWEDEHGEIPDGAAVAMLSGWADKVPTDGFRNADADGVMHFPGFHVEAADFLMRERNVVGMAVDTLSLDHGPSGDFATHYLWLPSNRWGLECVANLDQLPAAGATLVAGSPKTAGGTGGPSRLIALA